MSDPFSKHSSSLTGPPRDGMTILVSDTNDLRQCLRGLYVGGGGDVCVRMRSGVDVVLENVRSGTLLPMRVVRVLATGTTATHLVGVW